MKKSFQELVDLSKLQELTDEFYRAFSIPSSIMDLNGNILTRSGWQKICSDFHRKHPKTQKACIDIEIKVRKQLDEGTPYAVYKCPQGLVDGMTPIEIDGETVANVIAGQVMLEKPTEATMQFFRQQAAKYGFDEKEYLDALKKVPILTEKEFRSALSFLVKLARVFAEIGSMRLREIESSESLVKNQEKYRDLFENISDVYYRTDPEGIIMVVSPSVEKILGYSPEELIGIDLTKLHVYPEKLEKFRSEIRKYGHVKNFDAPFNAKDGSVKWVASNAKAITDEEGNVTGIEGIARDITDLIESEADIQALVESTVGITGTDFFKIIVNRLCKWLNCECAVIGEIINDTEINSLAVTLNGRNIENFTYDISGSPCRDAVKKDFCIFKENVSDLFPENSFLKDMNASGYVGIPLINSYNGKLLGIICAISSKKLILPRRAMEVLKIIGARVAAEIKWKKTKEDLKKSEDRYRGLVENINEVVYQTDSTGMTTYISPNIKTIAGYDQSEIVGKGYFEFVHPEDRKSRYEYFLKAMSGKKTISEFRFITKDNQTIWIRTNAAPIIKDGKITGVQGILSNINDRKEMEEALKKNTERLETIITHTPAGIVIIDPETHTIVDANPKAVKMIGAPLEKLIGSACHNFICPSEKGKCPITDLKQNIDDAERKLIKADGSIIPVHKTVLNLNIEGRDLLMECFVDISGHKNAEEERLKKEKLQAVVETAGAVCHELNQPLMGIMGIAELLELQGNTENPYYDKVTRIKNQVARMGAITRKLMNITRYETMKYLDKEIIDIEKSTD